MKKLLISLVNILEGPYMWVLLLAFIVVIYLLLSFFSHSFKKPFKYMGIATVLSGLSFIALRVLFPMLIETVLPQYVSVINLLMSRILMTILVMGIVYIILGVLSICIYYLISKTKKEDFE